MKMNEAFGTPLITPTTKAEFGEHDLPISGEEIVAQELVDGDVWREVEEKALALFARGTEVAAERGLILVDTKYEFGIRGGKLYIVDEVHTPDSSRYWYSDTYAELFAAGKDQRKLDKEFLRKWLMDRNWMGDGPAPEIPDETKIDVAKKYIAAYETVTGRAFEPDENTLDDELKRIARYLD